jgi:putative SOS response-associated peptidase YedK
MCTNYRPGARDYIRERFGAELDFAYPEETYPGYAAPIIRRAKDGSQECLAARFGLIPFWSKDATIARRTYNARSERSPRSHRIERPGARDRAALYPWIGSTNPFTNPGSQCLGQS